MATKIRLKRVGSKKNSIMRIVVADSRSPRDGRFIEQIGTYNPSTEPEKVTVNKDRAQYWLGVGATPSETVKSIFKKNKLAK